MDETHVCTRWMIRARDMTEVLANEAAAHGPAAWSEEDFLRALRSRKVIGTIAEAGEKVVGHMVYELNDGHLRILNLTAGPGPDTRGVLTLFLDKLKSKLSSHRRTKIVTTVADAALDAHRLLSSQGFKATRVLRHACDDGGDAYEFTYALPNTPPPDDGVDFDQVETFNRVFVPEAKPVWNDDDADESSY